MAEIRIEHLHKAFGAFTAVRDSSFTVRDGDFFCLLGPSGCCDDDAAKSRAREPPTSVF
jgi:ABC-type Fe3+/spermidine/putrescine transport system ATPase subunit